MAAVDDNNISSFQVFALVHELHTITSFVWMSSHAK
jgi:hypothetical protein